VHGPWRRSLQLLPIDQSDACIPARNEEAIGDATDGVLHTLRLTQIAKSVELLDECI